MTNGDWEQELSRDVRALLATLIHGDSEVLDDVVAAASSHGLAAVEVLQNYGRLALFSIRDQTRWDPIDYLGWLYQQWDSRPSSSIILERKRRLVLDIFRGYLRPNASRAIWQSAIEHYESSTPQVREKPHADLTLDMARIAAWCVAQLADQVNRPAPEVLQTMALLVETNEPPGM